ncbi:EthD family reductase [Ottowia thiooxydans]|uniref:EthD family reductase n=1 Tax=Ottowia thiooxydans TaxID=219182 RepID=UPI0003FCF924|nr:EthD family reductase [Ottowia thiooxydans]
MINRFVFIERKTDISLDAFRQHWRQVHAPIAAQLPRLRQYTQYDEVGDSLRGLLLGSKVAIDGIALLAFDTIQDIEAAFTPEIVEALVADEGHFIGKLELVSTVPHLLGKLPEEEGSARRISLIKRTPGTTLSEFQQRWWHDGGKTGSVPEGAHACIRNLVIDRGFGRKRDTPYEEFPFDGIEETVMKDGVSGEALSKERFGRPAMGPYAEELAVFTVKAYPIV